MTKIISSIVEEIAAYEAEFQALLANWNSLSSKARGRAWELHLEAVDCGDAGWTTYALLLDTAFAEGFDPTGGLVQTEFGLAPARAAAPA